MTDLYAADVASLATSPEQLGKVLALSRNLYRLAEERKQLSLALDAKDEELRRLQEVDLPDAMREAAVEQQPLGGGWTAVLRVDVLSASLNAAPAEGQDPAQHSAAMAWLDQHHPDLVKRRVKIDFPKEEVAWFKKFMADLAKRKRKVFAAAEFFVHTQTLRKFVREQVKEDPAFPKEIFNVYERTYVELVPPSNRKGK